MGHALDGLDILAVGLDPQHQAGADEIPVHHHVARAAIAGRAAFLGACHVQLVAQAIEQGLFRVAQELAFVPVDGRCDVISSH